jgi:hypothetical protein
MDGIVVSHPFPDILFFGRERGIETQDGDARMPAAVSLQGQLLDGRTSDPQEPGSHQSKDPLERFALLPKDDVRLYILELSCQDPMVDLAISLMYNTDNIY